MSRNGSAVDFYEWFIVTFAVSIDFICNNFFTRAGFTGD